MFRSANQHSTEAFSWSYNKNSLHGHKIHKLSQNVWMTPCWKSKDERGIVKGRMLPFLVQQTSTNNFKLWKNDEQNQTVKFYKDENHSVQIGEGRWGRREIKKIRICVGMGFLLFWEAAVDISGFLWAGSRIEVGLGCLALQRRKIM